MVNMVNYAMISYSPIFVIRVYLKNLISISQMARLSHIVLDCLKSILCLTIGKHKISFNFEFIKCCTCSYPGAFTQFSILISNKILIFKNFKNLILSFHLENFLQLLVNQSINVILLIIAVLIIDII